MLLPLLTHLRPSKSRWDIVTPLGGWNYPQPILTTSTHNRPPEDLYLNNLIYMANYGWHYYQKAVVDMQVIHPYSNYRPAIHDEFTETFTANLDKDTFALLIYEKDGKLISSQDWESYWLYREYKYSSIPCIILGNFTPNNPSIATYDKPFTMTRLDTSLKSFETALSVSS